MTNEKSVLCGEMGGFGLVIPIFIIYTLVSSGNYCPTIPVDHLRVLSNTFLFRFILMIGGLGNLDFKGHLEAFLSAAISSKKNINFGAVHFSLFRPPRFMTRAESKAAGLLKTQHKVCTSHLTQTQYYSTHSELRTLFCTMWYSTYKCR